MYTSNERVPEGLMRRFDSPDPDQRFMALQDFKNQSTNTLQGRSPATPSVLILKVLALSQDTNSDVCNAALESLGVIASHAQEAEINLLLEKLLTLKNLEDDGILDPRTMALRSILTNMKDGLDMTNVAVAKILQTVQDRLLSHRVERHVLFDLDSLLVSFKSLSVSCINCKTTLSPLIGTLAKLLTSPFADNVVRKRDIQCLSYVTSFRQEILTRQVLQLIDESITSTTTTIPDDICRLLIASTPAVSESLLVTYCHPWLKRLAASGVENGLECFELTILGIDQLLQNRIKLAPEMQQLLTERSCEFMRFDPILVREDPEEHIDEMGLDQLDEENAYFSGNEDVSDDEDVSWRIRKASIRLGRDLLIRRKLDARQAAESVNAIIECVGDRDDAVSLEALSTLTVLFQDDALLGGHSSSPPQSPLLKRKRDTLCSRRADLQAHAEVHWQRLAQRLQSASTHKSLMRQVEALRTVSSLSTILFLQGQDFAWCWGLLSRAVRRPDAAAPRNTSSIGIDTQALALARRAIDKVFAQSDHSFASHVVNFLRYMMQSQSTTIVANALEVSQLFIRRCRSKKIAIECHELELLVQDAQHHIEEGAKDASVKEKAVAFICTVASLPQNRLGEQKAILLRLTSQLLAEKQHLFALLDGLKEVVSQPEAELEVSAWFKNLSSDLLAGLESNIAQVRRGATNLFTAYFESFPSSQLADDTTSSLRRIALNRLSRIETTAATDMIRLLHLASMLSPLSRGDFEEAINCSSRHRSDRAYCKAVCGLCYSQVAADAQASHALDQYLINSLAAIGTLNTLTSVDDDLENFVIMLLSSAIAALTMHHNVSSDKYVIDLIESERGEHWRVTALWALSRCPGNCKPIRAFEAFESLRLWISSAEVSGRERSAAFAAMGRLLVEHNESLIDIIQSGTGKAEASNSDLILACASSVVATDCARLPSDELARLYTILAACHSSYPKVTQDVATVALGHLMMTALTKLPIDENYAEDAERMRWSALQSLLEQTDGPADEDLNSILSIVFNNLAESNSKTRLMAIHSLLHVRPVLASEFSRHIAQIIAGGLKPDASLIRIVEMGPFKHQFDDGLSIRKLAFDCLLSFLLQNLKIEEPEALFKLQLKGMEDATEIRMVSYLCLVQWAKSFPLLLTEHLSAVVAHWRKVLTISTPVDAPDGADEQVEMTRAALRCIADVSKSSVEQTPEFKHLLLDLQSGPKSREFHAMLAV